MAVLDDRHGYVSPVRQGAMRKMKLNSTISNFEKQINEAYTQIGFEIYRIYHDQPLDEVAELIRKVNLLHQTITECKDELDAMNQNVKCPHCGKHITKDMLFCKYCGMKLVDESRAKCCSECGKPLLPGASFCGMCGHKNEE